MHFRLCNAGVTFQRLEDLMLTKLDIAVSSEPVMCVGHTERHHRGLSAPEQHLHRLEEHLRRVKPKLKKKISA